MKLLQQVFWYNICMYDSGNMFIIMYIMFGNIFLFFLLLPEPKSLKHNGISAEKYQKI